MKYWIWLPLLLASCGNNPGLTPIEQDGLQTVSQAVEAPILYTVEGDGQVPELLLPIFAEYKKTPLVLHVVWRVAKPPTTQQLAQFSGKKVKQYWDPESKTPSTGGKLKVNQRMIAMDRLGLRMALAQAAAFPNP